MGRELKSPRDLYMVYVKGGEYARYEWTTSEGDHWVVLRVDRENKSTGRMHTLSIAACKCHEADVGKHETWNGRTVVTVMSEMEVVAWCARE